MKWYLMFYIFHSQAFKVQNFKKHNGDRDLCRRALHYIRVRSTNALVSHVFLSFLSLEFGKRKKIWILAELKINLCCAVRLSWLCRVILAEELWKDQPSPVHLKWSAANISSYCLFLIFLSPSRLPSCGCCLFLYPQSFVFILTFARFTQPPCQFRLVSYIVYPAGEEELQKGQLPCCSESRSAFFFFRLFWQSTGNHTGMFTVKYANVLI